MTASSWARRRWSRRTSRTACAILALSRSPPNALGQRGVQVDLARPPLARPRSPAIAASTRGSSWAASATTSVQPSSATTTRAHHLGDLQRAAAAGGPPARHHAAHHVLGPEAAVAHPLVGPGPAVEAVEPGQLLVGEQRRDRRMVDLLSTCEPGRGDGTPAGLNALTICCGESGLTGCAERRRRPASASAWSLARPHAVHRARAEQLGEQLVVHVRAPGHAVVAHLGRRSARPPTRRRPAAGTGAGRRCASIRRAGRRGPRRPVGSAPGGGPSSNRVGLPAPAAAAVVGHRRGRAAGRGRPRPSAGSPYRPSWPSSRLSVSARSWQRATPHAGARAARGRPPACPPRPSAGRRPPAPAPPRPGR